MSEPVEPITDEKLAELRERAHLYAWGADLVALLARLDAERDARIAAEADRGHLSFTLIEVEDLVDGLRADLAHAEAERAAALARAVPEGQRLERVADWMDDICRCTIHRSHWGNPTAPAGLTLNCSADTCPCLEARYRLVPQPVPVAPEERT